jgi:pantoate--beta-alanine ligase
VTTKPVLANTREELRDALRNHDRVGFVPTMGALHEGHASLMTRAREEIGDRGGLVASIFVNPLQFGAGEDLDRYPRTLGADLEICAERGVDVVFAPEVTEVYPSGDPEVTVHPGPKAEVLEGRTRPGHFAGVLTVVAKLFGLVQPDVAVFGEKDYQQLVLIQQMVRDLCLATRAIGAPTLREPDGLALSSRNRYLDPESRQAAAALSRALRAGVETGAQGAQAVLAAAKEELRRTTGIELDYLELTAPDLGPAPAEGTARLLVAAQVGPARLIDNMAVHLGPTTEGVK